MATEAKRSKAVERFLNIIERAGNALPHPATLFLILAIVVLLLSGFLSLFDISVTHPGTKESIQPVNLLTREGLHLILTKMVTNFTSFAPLGTVLVAMLGIGVAERSELISSGIKLIVYNAGIILSVIFGAIAFVLYFFVPITWALIGTATIAGAIWLVFYYQKHKPKIILTFIIVFAGVLSNMASEVGYVLLVPLGAIMFMGANRHPIAGMAAAFAGVSGGYSANLLLGTVDPLLSGLSQDAAQIIEISYLVNPTCNYYFMVASTFLISLLGTWVTIALVEPRFGKYDGEVEVDTDINKPLSKLQTKGLIYALVTIVILIGLVLWGLIPEGGFLRDPENSDVLKSPFFKGIVAFIFIAAALAGLAYGIGAKTIKNDSDVMEGMGKTMSTMGIYIVLVFFAAQFVEYFKWTNLGLITAVKGAEGLQAILGLDPNQAVGKMDLIFIAIPFILLAAVINLLMGSASAKWGLMAPVFIPMFMLIGISPEFTQVAYRIGDSVTNIISPMMSYFALIIAFMQRYMKNVGIGTIIATMLPYSFIFTIAWILFLIIWILFGFPLGPGAGLFIPVQGA